MSVLSFYVERKSAYADEAADVLADLRSMPDINGVTGLRVINRYLAEGVDADTFNYMKNAVYSDPDVDNVYDALPDFGGGRAFAVELLPGQFDQEAHSFAQCVSLASVKPRPLTRCAKIYIFKGYISDKDFNAIKAWLINPVESRETSLDVPDTLAVVYAPPEETSVIDGFILLDEQGLKAKLSELSLAMDLGDLTFCQTYFRDEERRDPTITEIRVIDTYWSDHCRHTTFLTELSRIDIEDESIKDSYKRYLSLRAELGREDKPITLMDIAVIGAKALKARGILTDLDESEEINACSVKIEADIDGKPQDWLLMFKNETHNHPTEIEPFGGAATCLGGAIRDPMSGRSYVYQAMRITGAGDPRTTTALPGKLPQRKICRAAAAGYSSYGNQAGVAAGHLHEIYHPGYVAKRMELGAVIGAAPAVNVVRKRPIPGDVVILLGGKTGRDGCGGAAGSSKSHTVSSLETGGAEVQKGDAVEKRKIMRLFRNPEATRLIKRCNDFGAGGVSVAIGELADGISVDLDKVPVKYDGLNGTELAISESQERMAIVVAESDAARFVELAAAENLDAVVVAVVTEEPRMTLTWRGKAIVSLARSFLSSSGASKRASVSISSPVLEDRTYPELNGDDLIAFMGDLSVCSQKGLTERFDYSAGAATMLAPFGGAYQLTPSQVMAAKLPVPVGLGENTSTCSLMAWGFNPFISSQSPYHGAMYAVIQSVAKIIAAGGSRGKCWLTFQEYFERLREDPARWGKPAAALLGALDAQMGLTCGAVGGKDSMSGSFEDIDVPPALVSFAVSVAKAGNIISAEFKEPGGNVYFLRPGFDAFGNPDFPALRDLFDKVEGFIAGGKIKSAWAVDAGGAAEAVIKMGFGNRVGFAAVKPLTAEPVFGGFILEAADCLPGFEDCLLGTTTKEYVLTLANGQTVCMQELQNQWEQTLEAVYPCLRPSFGEMAIFFKKKNIESISAPATKTASPKFVIPLFPGTNSEYETEKAIAKAGGKTEIIVIRNRDESDIAESIRALERAVKSAQAIVLPGGGVSANFIVSLFRNSSISAAVYDLLRMRGGLICGFGAGLRALLKLGLLPHGKIKESDEILMALTGDKIGSHQSIMANVRVVSNMSPWLSEFETGYPAVVPVSSENIRFTADLILVRTLELNGQIATEFADLGGIEALTSPDGRVFGRIGHGERCNNGLFVNIPGNKEMDIFTGAVKYFLRG